MVNAQFRIEWYNQRRVVTALVLSMLIHATVLSLVPAWRTNRLQPQPVLSVQLPQFVRPQPAPVAPPAKPQPKLTPAPIITERAPSAFKLPQRPRIEANAAPRPKKIPAETPPVAPPQTTAPAETAPPAPVPTAPAPVALAKAVPERSLLDSYGKELSSLISKYQRYPFIAQLRGWQGTAQVQLVISANGKMDDATILRSSGYEVLDNQALDMVQQAAPLPLPPEALRDRKFTVVVPIVFKLND